MPSDWANYIIDNMWEKHFRNKRRNFRYKIYVQYTVLRSLQIFGTIKITGKTIRDTRINLKNNYCTMILYDNRSWKWETKERSNIKAAEMRFLRRIKGYPRREK